MKNFKNRIIAATPLISLLIFLFIGIFLKDYLNGKEWLIGSLAFFLIPINTILFAPFNKRRIKSIVILLSTLIFLILTLGFDLAHPGWIVFLSIPLTDLILNKKIDLTKITTMVIIIAYIVIGIITGDWHKYWIIFILVPIINILLGPHSILDLKMKDTKKKFKDFIDIEFVEKDDK